MSAALSQPDADRFSIFIDALIESPRFSFSAFCKAARLTAAEAITWFARPDITASLQSCMTLIQDAARIRHAALDTNAMGALGEILKSSENQIEIRRAATTIIARHRADLRASHSRSPRTPRDASRREAAPVTSPGRQTRDNSELPVSTEGASPHYPATPRGNSASKSASSLKETRDGCQGSARCEATAQPLEISLDLKNSAPARPSSTLCRENRGMKPHAFMSSLSTARIEPPPREPHSAKSILTRAGAAPSSPAHARDRPGR